MVVPIPKHREITLVMQPKAYTLGKMSSIGNIPQPIKPNIMPTPQQNTPNVAHTCPMVFPTKVVGTRSLRLSMSQLPAYPTSHSMAQSIFHAGPP